MNLTKTATRNLKDTDPMPFGKHQGTPMQDVPASYLHWLWVEEGVQDNKFHRLHGYIKRSLGALRMENPDLIW